MGVAPVTIVGLGAAGIDRVGPAVHSLLLDPGHTVVVRTLHHPACAELAEWRPVVSCDELYDSAAGFDDDTHFLLIEIAGDDLYFQAISRTGQSVDSGRFARAIDPPPPPSIGR